MSQNFRSTPGGLQAALLWLLPVLLILLYLLPLAGVFGWSFSRPDLGVDNYVRLVTDENVINVFIRTARICTVVTVLTILAAYIVAYQWVFGPPKRRLFMEVCIFIPFWISVLVRAFGWVILLRSKGFINEVLLYLGVISEPLVLVRTEFSVILSMVHFMIPFAVFPIASVMRQIDKNTLLASRGMGATPSFTFFNAFLPMTLSGVMATVIIVMVFSLGFFITPAILGGGKIVMIAEYVYIQMFQTTNWGFGAALSVALLAIVAGLLALMFKIVKPEKLVH